MPHNNIQDIENQIFDMPNAKFNDLALEILYFQLQNLEIFAQWQKHFPMDIETENPILHQLGIHFQPNFLPIQFFKSHEIIITTPGNPMLDVNQVLTFTSSGTTLSKPSKHFVLQPKIYKNSFLKGFELRFGNPKQYCIIGLLPSYLERSGSSLIHMVDHLIHLGKPGSGFYLDEYQKLWETLQQNEQNGIKTIVFGVTFGLLLMGTWIQNHYPNSRPLQNCILVETGGMKGRGPELTKQELHQTLQHQWNIQRIDSEYGMTELLSQAYTSPENGRFICPPWMKIIAQDQIDAKKIMGFGKTGRLCVMDLANLYSCAFIATDDLCKVYEDGSFEVLGRLDFSDTRGCNQLIQ